MRLLVNLYFSGDLRATHLGQLWIYLLRITLMKRSGRVLSVSFNKHFKDQSSKLLAPLLRLERHLTE